jgi:hypothetical protein
MVCGRSSKEEEEEEEEDEEEEEEEEESAKTGDCTRRRIWVCRQNERLHRIMRSIAVDHRQRVLRTAVMAVGEWTHCCGCRMFTGILRVLNF